MEYSKHMSHSLQNEARKIASFHEQEAILCEKMRDNLLANGTNESVADHIHKLGLLAQLIRPYLIHPVDPLKIIDMIQIHDLGEAKHGDVSLSLVANDEPRRQHKKQLELEAVCEYAADLPEVAGRHVIALYEEYTAGQTREAKIVHALDRLESTLQSNYNNGGVEYVGKCPNGVFYYNHSMKKHDYVAELDEPILLALEERIIEISARNIRRDKIELGPEGTTLLNRVLIEYRLVR